MLFRSIEEVLVASGTATIRRRRLPADQVIWIVLGMALYRNESIERVVETLDLALPSKKDEATARSAISVNICRINRVWLAPSATLTAVCGRPLIPRASSRFATLAQAMSRTRPETIINKRSPSP